MYGLTVNCVNYVPGRGVNSNQRGPETRKQVCLSRPQGGAEYLNPRPQEGSAAWLAGWLAGSPGGSISVNQDLDGYYKSAGAVELWSCVRAV